MTQQRGVCCAAASRSLPRLLQGQTKQQKRFTWFGKLTQNAMGLVEKTPQVSLAVLGKYGKLCEPLLVLMTEIEWFCCLNKILTLLPCFCELISNRKSNCTLKSVQGCFQHAFNWLPHEELDKARNWGLKILNRCESIPYYIHYRTYLDAEVNSRYIWIFDYRLKRCHSFLVK